MCHEGMREKVFTSVKDNDGIHSLFIVTPLAEQKCHSILSFDINHDLFLHANQSPVKSSAYTKTGIFTWSALFNRSVL